MQIHQIQSKNKKRKKKRIGRGGKRGTYSGRGVKGQKSRAGAKFKPMVRELIKRYPKLKGYRKQSVKKIKMKSAVVNLDTLEKKCRPGEEITPTILLDKKIISRTGKKLPRVKILAKGKITKKLAIKDCLVSRAARIKIEKAGGQVS